MASRTGPDIIVERIDDLGFASPPGDPQSPGPRSGMLFPHALSHPVQCILKIAERMG